MISIPSVDKDTRGFDGQKNVHAASKPLPIHKVLPAGFSLPERFSVPAKLLAPDSDGVLCDFWFLRRRRADARQGEKNKKRRKCTLSGVCVPVNRWYRQNIRNTAVLCSGVNCPRFRVFLFAAVYLTGRGKGSLVWNINLSLLCVFFCCFRLCWRFSCSLPSRPMSRRN